jgi:hypothetical protein
MKTKAEIYEFIKKGPKEQAIGNFLKEDLTILTEIYAFPKDEYICIPEYPIDDGYIDYIIMTGRSRMKIRLIEIKGADFNLLNKETNKLNEIMNHASQQMDTRWSYIERNYEYFRKKVHEYREKAENNTLNYTLLKGDKNLYVDKDKDIVIANSVVIGGRTTDDLIESQVKDDYERRSGYRRKIESWDSFLKKLTRD